MNIDNPKQPVLLNFSQQKAALQVLPRHPLLSSEGTDWGGIRLEYHQQPPWATPEFLAQEHIISIVTTEHPYLNERKEQGQCKARYDRSGDIYIYPAKQPIQHCWHAEVQSIHLYLEPQLFVELSEDFRQTTVTELLPQVGIRDSLIQEIGLALKSELEQGNSDRFYAESAAAFLVAHLARRYCHSKVQLPSYVGGLSKLKLKQVITYIQAHLTEDISLAEMATAVGMSPYYFCRLFKQSMGISPYQYVIECRIDRAKELLSQGEKSIAEVALEVGFASQSQFTKHFKRIVGITPKQMRT